MKRILPLAVCICVLICTFSVFVSAADPYSGECGNGVRWHFDETNGRLTLSGTGEMKNYTEYSKPGYANLGVEEIVIEEGITDIGYYAFYKSSAKRVVIPTSVRFIWFSAFEGCESLASVEGMQAVEKLESRAFYGCASLERIDLPPTLQHLGRELFANSGLLELEIPKCVNNIAPLVIASCDSLKTLTVSGEHPLYYGEGNCVINHITRTLILGCNSSVIPNASSVNSISAWSFSRCNKLESIDIPENIEYIDSSAFFECGALKEIILPSKLRSISNITFSGSYAIESMTVRGAGEKYICRGNCIIDADKKTVVLGCNKSIIPDDTSVTVIGIRAFENCTELVDLNIPSSIEKISDHAFEGCTGLSTVTTYAKEIGSSAFSGCSSLKRISFIGGVKRIEHYAFSGCTSLENVIMCCTKDEYNNMTLDIYYATGAAPFEMKRHDRVLEAINYQMHALHCKVCGDAEELEEHSASGWKYVNDSKHKGVCKCGFALEDTHEWVESEWSIPATKNKQGAKRYYCAICDSERTEIVPMLHGCESNVISAPYISVIALSLSLLFRKGRLRKNGEA